MLRQIDNIIRSTLSGFILILLISRCYSGALKPIQLNPGILGLVIFETNKVEFSKFRCYNCRLR